MEKNQTQPSLEDMLLGIGSLHGVSKQIDKTKSFSERGDLYDIAAKMIAGPPKLKDEKENKAYYDTIREFRVSPEYAQMEISGVIDKRADSIEEEYKKGKDKITKNVAQSINKQLSEAKNKAEALDVIALYLSDSLGEVPELDQKTANDYARDELMLRTGLPYAFETEGRIADYKDMHKGIGLRVRAGEYLKEKKKGEEVMYSIDEAKLGKIMDKPREGAVLYTRAKSVDEQIKKVEKAKKAKK